MSSTLVLLIFIIFPAWVNDCVEFVVEEEVGVGVEVGVLFQQEPPEDRKDSKIVCSIFNCVSVFALETNLSASNL
jgi:hypothetical protein